MATLACYINNPQAALTKGTLFQKTVLAAAVSLSPQATADALLKAVQSLTPEESVDSTRLWSALDALKAGGFISVSGDAVAVKPDFLVTIGESIQQNKAAINDVTAAIIRHCKTHHKLSQADVGYLERNTRLAILSLIRNLGPLQSADQIATESSEQGLLTYFTRDLTPDIAHSAVTALSSYVSSSAGRAHVAVLVRSYTALALRNLDPVGRRWQANVLSRSTYALDTDVVVTLIVTEVPEHPVVLGALRALQSRGIAIVVPESVLDEAVDNISRGANSTYARFASVLARFPEEMVEGSVWNAVVRGYYYSLRKGPRTPWHVFHAKYWDEKNPTEYAVHILQQRLKLAIVAMDIPLQETPELEAAVAELLQREKHRPKAPWRTEEEMRNRIYRDLRILFHLATRESIAAEPKGYFVSGDFRLSRVEGMSCWKGLPSVWQPVASLPEFAALVAGFDLSDDAFVRLLFSPIIAAAAQSIHTELEELVRIGVDLRDVSLERLEWGLKKDLMSHLQNYRSARANKANDEVIGTAALEVAEAAAGAGFKLDPEIKAAADSFRTLEIELQATKVQAETTKQDMSAMVKALAGSTRKGAKRFRRAMLRAGVDPEKYVAMLRQ